MSNEEIIKVTKEQLDAFMDKDWDKWSSVSAEDCTYDEIATQNKYEGRENVLAAMKGWTTAFPDVKGSYDTISIDGNRTTLQMTWTGKHTGPLHTPDGEIPATGKEIQLKSCMITEVEDGKVKAFQNYFDMMTMLTQLGLTN